MSTPKYQCEITQNLFILVFNILQSSERHVRLHDRKYKVFDFRRRASEFLEDEANDPTDLTHYKALTHKQPVVVPGFQCSDDAVLRES